MKALAALVMKGMAATGKTYKMLAEETGYTEAYIRMIAGGDRTPRNPIVLGSLQEALGLTYEELAAAVRTDLAEGDALSLARRRTSVKRKPPEPEPVVVTKKARRPRVHKGKA